MKVKEIIDLIEADGWRLARTRGSHRQFKHPLKPGTVTIAGKPNLDMPPGTLKHFETIRFEEGEGAMKYTVIVEKSQDGFGAYVPDLPGFVAVGETREEVLLLVREAIEFHIESMKESGKPIPDPITSSELVEV